MFRTVALGRNLQPLAILVLHHGGKRLTIARGYALGAPAFHWLTTHSAGILSAFASLHFRHSTCMFRVAFAPPFESGTT